MSVIIFTIHNVSIYTIHMDPMGIHIALSFINHQETNHRGLFDHRHHGHGVQALPRPGRCVARARYGGQRCQGVGKNMGGV